MLSTLSEITKRALLLMFMATTFAGCYTFKKDVTHKVEYHKYFKLGQVYSLMDKSMLLPKHGYRQVDNLFEIVPEYSEERVNKTLSYSTVYGLDKWYLEFMKDKPEPKGMLKSGTRFKIIGFYRLKFRGIGIHEIGDIHLNEIDPVGEILDGPYKGSVFSVRKISKEKWSNNPRELTYAPNDTIEIVK